MNSCSKTSKNKRPRLSGSEPEDSGPKSGKNGSSRRPKRQKAQGHFCSVCPKSDSPQLGSKEAGSGESLSPKRRRSKASITLSSLTSTKSKEDDLSEESSISNRGIRRSSRSCSSEISSQLDSKESVNSAVNPKSSNSRVRSRRSNRSTSSETSCRSNSTKIRDAGEEISESSSMSLDETPISRKRTCNKRSEFSGKRFLYSDVGDTDASEREGPAIKLSKRLRKAAKKEGSEINTKLSQISRPRRKRTVDKKTKMDAQNDGNYLGFQITKESQNVLANESEDTNTVFEKEALATLLGSKTDQNSENATDCQTHKKCRKSSAKKSEDLDAASVNKTSETPLNTKSGGRSKPVPNGSRTEKRISAKNCESLVHSPTQVFAAKKCEDLDSASVKKISESLLNTKSGDRTRPVRNKKCTKKTSRVQNLEGLVSSPTQVEENQKSSKPLFHTKSRDKTGPIYNKKCSKKTMPGVQNLEGLVTSPTQAEESQKISETLFNSKSGDETRPACNKISKKNTMCGVKNFEGLDSCPKQVEKSEKSTNESISKIIILKKVHNESNNRTQKRKRKSLPDAQTEKSPNVSLQGKILDSDNEPTEQLESFEACVTKETDFNATTSTKNTVAHNQKSKYENSSIKTSVPQPSVILNIQEQEEFFSLYDHNTKPTEKKDQVVNPVKTVSGIFRTQRVSQNMFNKETSECQGHGSAENPSETVRTQILTAPWEHFETSQDKDNSIKRNQENEAVIKLSDEEKHCKHKSDTNLVSSKLVETSLNGNKLPEHDQGNSTVSKQVDENYVPLEHVQLIQNKHSKHQTVSSSVSLARVETLKEELPMHNQEIKTVTMEYDENHPSQKCRKLIHNNQSEGKSDFIAVSSKCDDTTQNFNKLSANYQENQTMSNNNYQEFSCYKQSKPIQNKQSKHKSDLSFVKTSQDAEKFPVHNQKCQTISNGNNEKHPIPKPSQTIENKITNSAILPSGLAETEYVTKVPEHVLQNKEIQTSKPGRPRRRMQKRTKDNAELSTSTKCKKHRPSSVKVCDAPKDTTESKMVHVETIFQSLCQDTGFLLKGLGQDASNFSCPKCNKVFTSPKFGAGHYSVCSKKFQSTKNKNVLISYSNVVWICSRCHSFFDQHPKLSEHKEVCFLSNKTFKCKKCGYKCLHEITFKDHPCDKNIKKMQSCTVKIPTLDITQSIRSKLQYFECTTCCRFFLNQTSFKYHVLTTHNVVSPDIECIKSITVNNTYCDSPVQVKRENISPERTEYSSEGLQNLNNVTFNTGTPMTGSMAAPLAHSAQVPLIENTSSVNPQPKRDQRARHHNTQASESIGRSDALDLEHLFRSFDECICATSTPGEDTKPCASCLRKFLKQDSLNLNVDDGSADVNLDLLFAETNRAQYFARSPPISTPLSPRESLSSGSVENRSNFQSHFSEESAIEGNPSYLVGEEASSYSEGEECAEDNLTIDEAPDYVNSGLSVPFPEDNLTKFPIVRGVHPVPTPTLSRKNPSSGLFNSHSDVHSRSTQESALENNPCSLVGDECNSRTSSTINDVANPSLDMDWIASCLGDINAAENSLGDIDPVANLAGDFGYSASPSGDIHTANTPDNHCVVRPSSYIDSNKGPSSNTDCNLELLFGENCKTQPLRDIVFNVNSSSDLECNSNPADGFSNDIEPSFLIDSNDSRLTNNDGNTQPSSNITSDSGPSSDISFESIQSTVNCNPKLSSDIPCIQESSTITFGVPKPPKQCRLIAKDKTQSGGISCNEANSLDIQCNKTKSMINDCSAISSSNFNYKGITSPGHHSNSLLSCDSHCNAESTDVDCSLRLSPTMTESIGKDESLIDSPQFQAFFISNKTYSSQKEFRTDVSRNLSTFKRTVMAYKVLPETPNASSSINKEPVLISGKLRCVMEESSSSITLPMSDEVEPMPVSVELNPIEQDSSLQNTVLVPFAEHDPISGEHGPMENDSCSQKTLPGPVAELVPASKETGTTEKDSSLQNTVPVFVEEALVPVSEDTKPIQKDFSQKSGVTPTGEVIGSPKPGPVTAESSELSAMPIHNRHETVSGEPKQMTQSTVPEFRANVPTVRTSLITYEPFEADAFAVASSHDDNIVLRYFCSHCFCNFQLNSLNDHLCSTHNKPANVEIKRLPFYGLDIFCCTLAAASAPANIFTTSVPASIRVEIACSNKKKNEFGLVLHQKKGWLHTYHSQWFVMDAVRVKVSSKQ
ncbi:hypothetical protein JTE90_024148 [Oedothorax gibbosus]|uniref:C2H2-type domain-containing protein n=1 Tax=Oedothorax gibbosus TaxID=931172 RepID=A0AAV6U6M4_9ARAC|nr:hypothetical protein JTE90_024148 [Oedothorax gibbosus]